ncbi:MAG: pyridoxal-phosphate dependent enzyme [Chitinophagales bacterium]|nr:pyridoxal-phosphate dependent enzyme [Bacteroidota bacterium]MBP7400969.1 pyridoxal-phosphate dependent enzyme [Chitinophagales bacterium]
MQLQTDKIVYKDFPIDILRLDLIGDKLQGNKYFKLKYNIAEAKNQKLDTLLTFGGAFSNHIYATAAAGKEHDIKTIGIIRGEDNPNNPTLQFAKSMGMQLEFINREAYQHRATPAFETTLKNKFGNFYLLPEGGTNDLAIQGCAEILSGIKNKYDRIFLPVGTGGTIAGIISTQELKTHVTGISVLRGDDTLTKAIKGLAKSPNADITWDVNFNFHYGGYAKFSSKLIEFIRKFYKEYNIMLDPIYTGKMMGGIFFMIDHDKIEPGKKILAIHTGGLQGIDGWEYRFEKIIKA